jgi:hypothetical protein
VGVLLAGALADQLGVVTILNVQAGIYILCGLLAFAAVGPHEPARGDPALVDPTRIE